MGHEEDHDRMSARAYALIFVLGGVAGTAYDYVHVVYGVLSYAHPHVGGTSLWVPIFFGGAAVIGALLVRALARRIKAPSVSVKRAVFDATLLLVAYFVTGVLMGNNSLTCLVLALIAAIVVATRPSRFVFVCAAIAAVAGPVGETLNSWSGFFHYNVADPIPYWLPLLWVVASGIFLDMTLLLSDRLPLTVNS
jgi:hypothetical protein